MKTPLFDIDNWKEIGATLSRNKTRTFLTGFGIFWGVAMLAMLMGGARGAEDIIRRNFEGFATNSAFCFPQQTTLPYKGQPKWRSWSADLIDVQRLSAALPQLETVTYEMFGNTGTSFRNGKYSYAGQVVGVTPDFVKVNEPVLVSGRFINEADEKFERKVAVIGKKVVEQIFPDEPDPVGKMVEINGVNYTIIGVVTSASDINIGGDPNDSAMLPSNTFRRAFNRGIEVGLIMLVAKPGYKMKDLEDKIYHIIYNRHSIDPADKSAMWFADISENFEMVDSLFRGISLLALFIGLSTLIAGIIGIGNIMWVIVKERTQEIGIRRAIGATPRDIIVQVLSEGVALTTVAGLAGITFAVIVLGIMAHVTAQPGSIARFQMSMWQAMQVIAVFIILGTAAGLIPSLKAMKIKPIEAINDK